MSSGQTEGLFQEERERRINPARKFFDSFTGGDEKRKGLRYERELPRGEKVVEADYLQRHTTNAIDNQPAIAPRNNNKFWLVFSASACLYEIVTIMASSAIERPPPSVWAVAFASALISGLAGYFLGQASSIGVFSKSSSDPTVSIGVKNAHDAGVDESEEEGDDEDEDNQEINSFADHNEECKLVLVVRTDLGMTKGV